MNILTVWLRAYLPTLPVDDRQLAEDLTLRGIAVEGEFPVSAEQGACGGARFEMDITTNRVDAMNHYGVAREAAAIYNLPLAALAATAPIEAFESGEGFPVRIEADDLCGRFTARIVRGVKVGPSHGLLADYFAALGQKPISAPVDVTNFGWLAMGQPTHVFDLDTLVGGIVVRRAREGEKLRLLDGSEHTLVADDLVIADEKKALGLAGVMGGWDSRVTESTRNILVEAAWFDPAAIRASSRRHGLHTDASHRFERGCDFAAAPLANNLVARMVAEQSGGTVSGPLVDVVVSALEARTAKRPAIALRSPEVFRHLGTTLAEHPLSEALIAQYLTALGCVLTATAAGEYSVTLPSWRLDLEREIDLIEEVARVHGYNRFADTLPRFSGEVALQPHAAQERAMRSTLLALGYSEAISSTFAAVEDAEAFAAAPAVAMGNPLSAEAGVLRPALAPGMATMLAHNLHRDVASARLFELGTVFTGSTDEVHESVGLAIGATGAARASALCRVEDALFYEVKSALETLLAKFAGVITFDGQRLPGWIAAGRGARALVNGTSVAVFGELSAAELQRRKLRQTVVIAEVDAQALLDSPLRQPVILPLSRLQAVERDFSFLFPDSVSWSTVEAAVRGLPIKELQSVRPVEVYRDPKGKSVAAGNYSLLLRVVLQSLERTLTEEELNAGTTQILAALTTLGGTQRA